MDSFDLEPWSMFQGDEFMVADADSILADDLLQQQQQHTQQQQQQQYDQTINNGGVRNDVNGVGIDVDLLADVKCEPIDCQTEDADVELNAPEEVSCKEQDAVDDVGNVTKGRGNHNKPMTKNNSEEYDDNQIFNFGLEETIGLDGSVAAKSNENGTNLRQRDKLNNTNSLGDTAINYEMAVVYICPACGMEFNAQCMWKLHINGVHNYNTRRGLNFVPVDKLYHRCLECHRRIAMHAMENLLKHKFTHLPYRCTKCKICNRLYKYRQDLMVHLRTIHREELLVMTLNPETSSQSSSSRRTANNWNTSRRGGGLEIMDIKGNAVDIFEGSLDESIKVKNELIDDDDVVRATNAEVPLVDDSVPSEVEFPKALQKHIAYICPKCSDEFGNFSEWNNHIDIMHNYKNIDGLNFMRNRNNELQCLDCHVVLSVKSVQAMQTHKFSHLKNNATMRCDLCRRCYTDRREIIKHLKIQHCIENQRSETAKSNHHHQSSNDVDNMTWGGNDNVYYNDNNDASGNDDDQMQINASWRNEEKDIYETHVEYLCPQCGREFFDKKQWRRHIVKRHHFDNLKVLNFRIVDKRHVQCLECRKIITNAYGINNAQQHRITHMPYKSFIRCRICSKTYTDRKCLVKHLRSVHCLRQVASRVVPLPVSHARQKTQPTNNVRASAHNYLHKHQQKPQPQQQQQQQKQKSKQPFKEIVRHAEYTYEIQYLDDDDDDDEEEEETQSGNKKNLNSAGRADESADYDDDDDDNALLQLDETPLPELSFTNSRSKVNSAAGTQTKRGFLYDQQRSNRWGPNNTQHVRAAMAHSSSGGGGGGGGGSSRKRTYEELTNEDTLFDPTVESTRVHNVDDDDEALLQANDSDDGIGLIAKITKAADCPDFERYFSYLCPTCGIEYRSQREWRHHINNVHHYDKREHLGLRALDENRFQCIQCHAILINTKLKGLQEHKFRHSPFKLYIKCELCGIRYNHKPNMIKHLHLRHSMEMMGGEDELPTAVESHANTNAKAPTKMAFNRNTAAATSASPSALADGENNSSAIYHATFYNSAVDHETIAYFCPCCNKNFDSHVNWRKHIVAEHNLNSRVGLNFRQIDEHHFLCLQCYKRVTVTHNKGAIGQLQSHKFRHLPYKSFHCTACNNQFVRKQMFFKHLNKKTKRCRAAGNKTIKNMFDSADNKHAERNAHDDEEYDSRHLSHDATNVTDGNGSVVAGVGVGVGGDDDVNVKNLPSTEETYILLCPDCGMHFDTARPWREHINVRHDLGKREKLRFRKFNSDLHQCVDCRKYVVGKKLRDLQIHRFKHLPYGSAYIRCRYCKSSFQEMKSLQYHLLQKHFSIVKPVRIIKSNQSGGNNDADCSISNALHDDEADDDDENTNLTNTTTTTTTTAAVVNESSSNGPAGEDDGDDGDYVNRHAKKRRNVYEQKTKNKKSMKIIKGDNDHVDTELDEDDDDDDDENDGGELIDDADSNAINEIANDIDDDDNEDIEGDDDETDIAILDEYSNDDDEEQYLLG